MLRSEKRITPRDSLVCPEKPKEPAKRMSGDPCRYGGIGESEAYHSVSQGVEGCMKDARSAAAEPLVVGGGKDIWRSSDTVGHEMERNWRVGDGVDILYSAGYEDLASKFGRGGSGTTVGVDGLVERLIFGCDNPQRWSLRAVWEMRDIRDRVAIAWEVKSGGWLWGQLCPHQEGQRPCPGLDENQPCGAGVMASVAMVAWSYYLSYPQGQRLGLGIQSGPNNGRRTRRAM